jgi:hypothetical protein
MQKRAALGELGVHAAQAMPGANGVPGQSVRAGTKSSQQALDDSDLSKQPRGPQAARPNTSFKLRVEMPPDGLGAAMWDLSMRPSTATLLVAARQALGAQPTIGEQRRQRAHAQLSARSSKVYVPLIPLHLRCLLHPSAAASLCTCAVPRRGAASGAVSPGSPKASAAQVSHPHHCAGQVSRSMASTPRGRPDPRRHAEGPSLLTVTPNASFSASFSSFSSLLASDTPRGAPAAVADAPAATAPPDDSHAHRRSVSPEVAPRAPASPTRARPAAAWALLRS